MRRAFTLVEMIVVMVVVMMIFAMMLPAMAPLMAKSGVDGAAWQLSAGLMQARSLAARTNRTCWVTFNMATSAGALSRDNQDSWWAIVTCSKSNCDGSCGCKNTCADGCQLNWAASNAAPTLEFESNQVGPLYRLNEGAAFLAVSYQDSASVPWYKFGASGPTYGSGAAIAPRGWTGNYRIGFNPTGTPMFYMNNVYCDSGVGSTGEPENYQFIIISKEGNISNKGYYINYLAVYVDVLTGMPSCMKVLPPDPVIWPVNPWQAGDISNPAPGRKR